MSAYHVIQSIGNLTLVNNRLNLSNDPWEKKRITLDNHTTLFLNKALLNNAPDVLKTPSGNVLSIYVRQQRECGLTRISSSVRYCPIRASISRAAP